jgi:hypothetical protein
MLALTLIRHKGTATPRMLSPKRASLIDRIAFHAAATRAQHAIRSRVCASSTWPTTVVVQAGPKQRLIGLGVEMQHRLGQCVQATDPHPGRRERVHPGDHANATVIRVGLDHRAQNGVQSVSTGTQRTDTGSSSRRSAIFRQVVVHRPADQRCPACTGGVLRQLSARPYVAGATLSSPPWLGWSYLTAPPVMPEMIRR